MNCSSGGIGTCSLANGALFHADKPSVKYFQVIRLRSGQRHNQVFWQDLFNSGVLEKLLLTDQFQPLVRFDFYVHRTATIHSNNYNIVVL